jgi:hypothetical protein
VVFVIGGEVMVSSDMTWAFDVLNTAFDDEVRD